MKSVSAKIKKGAIHLVPFPFTDLSKTKLRPCVVLGVDREDITVVFITSMKPKDRNFIELLPTKQNGVKAKSYIRSTKIATLDRKMSLGGIGMLEQETHGKLVEMVAAFLSSHH